MPTNAAPVSFHSSEPNVMPTNAAPVSFHSISPGVSYAPDSRRDVPAGPNMAPGMVSPPWPLCSRNTSATSPASESHRALQLLHFLLHSDGGRGSVGSSSGSVVSPGFVSSDDP